MPPRISNRLAALTSPRCTAKGQSVRPSGPLHLPSRLSLTRTKTAERYVVHELLTPTDPCTPCHVEAWYDNEEPGHDVLCYERLLAGLCRGQEYEGFRERVCRATHPLRCVSAPPHPNTDLTDRPRIQIRASAISSTSLRCSMLPGSLQFSETRPTHPISRYLSGQPPGHVLPVRARGIQLLPHALCTMFESLKDAPSHKSSPLDGQGIENLCNCL